MGAGPSSKLNLDTVVKRVQYFSDIAPDRELFVFYNEGIRTAYTCRQLYQLAGKFAFRLRYQYGFQRKDVIGSTLPGSPERLITDLGIILAGCIPMNFQILLSDGADFFQSARLSQCKAVIVCPDGSKPAYRLLEKYSHTVSDTSTDLAQFSNDQTPDLKSAILVSRDSKGSSLPFLEELRMSNDETFVEESVAPDDVLAILTTSGSTGYSKLVPWTHRNTIDNWQAAIERGPLKTFGLCTYYNNGNLGWIGGSPYLSYIYGYTRVMFDGFYATEPVKSEDVWRVICKENCQMGYIGCKDADDVAKHVESLTGTQHKCEVLIVGGQPVKKSQIQRLLTLTKTVQHVYGSTEGGILCHKVITASNVNTVKDFCVGPIDKKTIRIVNENGENCKPREVGIVQVKSKFTFKGYYNPLEDPDPQTEKAFTKDGWFHTCDTAYVDEDGEIHIMGRTNDVIMYGMSVLYPGWMEARLLTNPKISEALVVPVSDPIMYHKLCVCVEPLGGSQIDEDELKEFCKNIFLTNADDSFTPMPEFFLIMDSMPQTSTGKADRKVLRQMADEKFGVKEDQ